jgi:hypothetical protein
MSAEMTPEQQEVLATLQAADRKCIYEVISMGRRVLVIATVMLRDKPVTIGIYHTGDASIHPILT